MHVVAGDREATLHRMTRVRGRRGLRERLQGAALWVASRLFNYPRLDAGPRVTIDFLDAGGVRVACSVLFPPFAEFDLDEPYGAPPEGAYFDRLVAQLERSRPSCRAIDAGGDRAPGAELDAALAAGQDRVRALRRGRLPPRRDAARGRRQRPRAGAARGVAYVTLAHLFWRQVAANAPALPFLPDPVYDVAVPAAGDRLSPLGEAAVRAMYGDRDARRRQPHARRRRSTQTFALLDASTARRRRPASIR